MAQTHAMVDKNHKILTANLSLKVGDRGCTCQIKNMQSVQQTDWKFELNN